MNKVILIGIILFLFICNAYFFIRLFIKRFPRRGCRRKFLRLPVDIVPDIFHVIGELDIMLNNTAIIKNLSVSGMAMETNVFIKKNKKVSLKFNLPGSEKQIDVIGQVVWVGKDFHEIVMGIHFIKIKKDDSSFINEFVSSRLKKD